MSLLRASLHVAAVLGCATALSSCGSEEAAGEGARPPTLFLAGDGELWVVNGEAETSQMMRIPELHPGDPPHRIVARGDRLVVWGWDTYTLDPRRPERPPQPLATHSEIFLPSDHPERVWIRIDPGPGEPQTIREVAASGEVTVPDARPPAGSWPAAALAHGLVMYPNEEGEVIVWDPTTGAVSRQFPSAEIQDMGPAHGDRLVSCPFGCRKLWLTDMLSGERSTIEASGEFRFHVSNGAFSPDGETIALPVEDPTQPADRAFALALVSLPEQVVTVVPGSDVPDGYVIATWTEDGEDVFLTGGERFGTRRVVLYELGDATARKLDVDVGDFYDAAAW